MIEVEKKFLLTAEDEKRLIDGAEFIGEKVFTDIYYDKKDFSLTTKDKWLRSREGKFEFKISLNLSAEREADEYDEIEDENEIRRMLNIPTIKDMKSDVEDSGHSIFCICKTTRKKYKKGIFGIDIDFVEFADFNCELAEIELMVQDKSDIPGAIEKIIEFAKENNLRIGPVHGKGIQYLKRKNQSTTRP